MNFIHTKTRFKLNWQTTDKLVFIYKNQRALRRIAGGEQAKEEEARHAEELNNLLELQEDHALHVEAQVLGKRKRIEDDISGPNGGINKDLYNTE
jgi:hypothetical protein